MTDCWDSVIVGGGPAGCAAAYALAKRGHRVVIVDRRSFPREKACAGGLTIKTLNRLPYSVAPVIERVCRNVHLARNDERSVVGRSRRPTVAMTQRAMFDEFCMRRTLEAGAEFRKIGAVLGVHESTNEVQLDTDQGPIHGRFLIGADGAASTIRRRIWSEERQRSNGFGIEACLPCDRTESHHVEFDFGVVDGGYGWVFPKRDHLNVGVYTHSPDVRIDRRILLDYVSRRFPDRAAGDLEGVIGSPVGLARPGGWPVTGRVTLVGDAAQVVDPLLGEGIYYALWSGQEAAAAVDRELNGHCRFTREMRRRGKAILSDLRSNWRLTKPFYSRPGLGYGVLSSFPIRTGLLAGFAKGWTISQTKNRNLLVPFLRGAAPRALDL